MPSNSKILFRTKGKVYKRGQRKVNPKERFGTVVRKAMPF